MSKDKEPFGEDNQLTSYGHAPVGGEDPLTKLEGKVAVIRYRLTQVEEKLSTFESGQNPQVDNTEIDQLKKNIAVLETKLSNCTSEIAKTSLNHVQARKELEQSVGKLNDRVQQFERTYGDLINMMDKHMLETIADGLLKEAEWEKDINNRVQTLTQQVSQIKDKLQEQGGDTAKTKVEWEKGINNRVQTLTQQVSQIKDKLQEQERDIAKKKDILTFTQKRRLLDREKWLSVTAGAFEILAMLLLPVFLCVMVRSGISSVDWTSYGLALTVSVISVSSFIPLFVRLILNSKSHYDDAIFAKIEPFTEMLGSAAMVGRLWKFIASESTGFESDIPFFFVMAIIWGILIALGRVLHIFVIDICDNDADEYNWVFGVLTGLNVIAAVFFIPLLLIV